MPRWDDAWHARLNQILVDLPFRPLIEQAEVRRTLAADPVAFALIYLDHHLKGKETGDRITFSEVHYEWATRALGWREPMPEPMARRHGEIAPRGCGKSTWWFLILPLWAAANGVKRFAAAFADTAAQAENHLATMKHEMGTNPLLRNDYPDLCQPARAQSGTTVADRMGKLKTRSGFVFAAKGIDSSALGMKDGEVRPDLLILDDVEPDEASYSPLLAEKRLGTIVDAVFPLNIYADVVMVGTVTMPGSVMHQIVKAAHGQDAEPWVAEENIQGHHYRAIAVNDDGTERSIWPAKWSLAWLQSRRHTREYAKNYDNDPMARDGVYWTRDDFRYGTLAARTRTLLWIDPAVTAKKTSDFTGLAVVSYSPTEGKVEVRHAVGVRLIGAPLKQAVARLVGQFPEITLVVIETNQGGDLWPDVFDNLPGVRIKTTTSSASKEVRFAEALRHYQEGRVLHSARIPILEEQQVAFPRGQYDDVADAACGGILRFLSPPKATHRAPTARAYV